MIMSAHIVEVGALKALSLLRAKPDPAVIDGLGWAESWLMNPLRSKAGQLPSTEVDGVALLASWDSDESLDRFLGHPLARPYERGWTARFEPVRSIGAWPGLLDVPRQERPVDGSPVAVLTMARVRLPRMRKFAAAAAAAEREAVHHPAFLEGSSLMRPPNLISTLSLWRSVKEMRQYTVGAYPGGHLGAMRRHDEQVFHHETVFIRLRPYAVEGTWKGRDPFGLVEPLSR